MFHNEGKEKRVVGEKRRKREEVWVGAGGSHRPWENCGRRHTSPLLSHGRAELSRWRQDTVGKNGTLLGNIVEP